MELKMFLKRQRVYKERVYKCYKRSDINENDLVMVTPSASPL